MDSFWPKVLGVLVVVAVAGAFVLWLRSGIQEAQKPERTFSDMTERDRKELLAEPNAADLVRAAQPQASQPGQPVQPQPAQPQPTQPAGQQGSQPKPGQPVQPQTVQPVQQQSVLPVTFYFTQVSEEEQIEAEQLLAMVPTGRSIGRLPMTGFRLMVDTCRQVMERWPGSIFDYKARRAMNEIPERFRARYGITERELDLTQFTKPRPNTTPYTIKEEQ